MSRMGDDDTEARQEQARESPHLRLATVADESAIDSLMKESTTNLFPDFYDARQTESSVQHVAAVDRMLIEDGTYYVAEVEGQFVACGGWSRRDKLYTGSGAGAEDARLLDPASEPARVRAMFVRSDWVRHGLGRRILEACEAAARAEGFRTLALVATMPGRPLYQSYGFRSLESVDVVLPDGTVLECESMEKPIDLAH
jgi:GNAT superfamily N-acetyltransferase